MTRVRIKHPHPNNDTKLQLLRILAEHLVYATKLILTPDSLIVLTRSNEDVDKIFRHDCSQTLTTKGFEPILPPEIRAKRTALIFNTDDYILSHSDEDIKKEIQQENSWASDGIDHVFRIPSTKILKVCFHDTHTAKTATDKGMLAFHMSIPHYNVKPEVFIPILTCMRCYALDTHTTNKCTMAPNYTACSECGSDEHTWKTCTSTTKKMPELPRPAPYPGQ